MSSRLAFGFALLVGACGGAGGSAGSFVPLASQSPSAADWSYSVLYSFSGNDGSLPRARLVLDAGGNLYGTTSAGGASNLGVVFRLTPDGRYTVLHGFSGRDGSDPEAGLILDPNGTLYGTTSAGGASNLGVVFKLAPDGRYAVLHNFSGRDGATPVADLVRDASGNVYGTTRAGGTYGTTHQGGVVYKVAPDGTETVLHSFSYGVPDSVDGAVPVAGLVFDAAGNLYGTTLTGGSPVVPGGLGGPPSGIGTVFKLAPDGTETILHTFGADAAGVDPHAGLVLDAEGNLYGTTLTGGCGAPQQDGAVFRLAPDGTVTPLHCFNGSDGSGPGAGLVRDGGGSLFGTTGTGGPTGLATGATANGVVFKLASGGTYTVLHSFSLSGAEGSTPEAGLAFDARGNLYGTAASGGASFNGVVFKLSPGGQ
jgi:uncharacterized repeat protein (TIGR03803 family)